MMKTISLVLMCLSFTSVMGQNSHQPSPKVGPTQPNILWIYVEDTNDWMSCYGDTVVETPNIDQLAAEGIRFSRFHTSPYCAPTRAMLLSGNDNHIAGMGRQSFQSNDFGYEGKLTERIVTIPALLREAGYHTYMAGKWHLGSSPDANPYRKGFEHSFILIRGAGNHYNDQGLFLEDPISPYTEDG